MKTRTTLALCALTLCLVWLGFSFSKATAAFTPAPTGAQVCGVISAYAPATANAAGSLTIGSLTFAIAPGFSIKGVAVGQDRCFSFCFNASGQISGQTGDASAGQNVPKVCGIVTSFASAWGSSIGSVTIGGARIRIAAGIYLGGQDQVAPGSNSCLIPSGAGDLVGPNSFFILDSAPKQVRIPTTVHGRTFGPNSQDDIFNLPNPTILTLNSDLANVFAVGPQTFGRTIGVDSGRIEGFSYSTPNSTLQALSCTESFWDIVMELASNGVTDGDMVTLNLLDSNKQVAQQVAMFTIQNGGAQVVQLHPDIKLTANGMNTKGVGYNAQFLIGAGASGLRTFPLALAFSTSSPAFNGCFQLAVEVKRASGLGTVTVVIENMVVKRMEQPNDRDVSINLGLTTNSLGWYPTGKVCDFVCWPCATLPPPPQGASTLSGFVYCDSNNNGVKDAGEAGIANVEIKLNGAQAKTTTTAADGSYHFEVIPGTYTITETQPSSSIVIGDGKDTAGSCLGDAGNDIITNIVVGPDSNCVNYNFGELCGSTKCDTICWRATQFFITNIRYLPGGTVLIAGVNANNPVAITPNSSTIRTALQGGAGAMQKLNREFVTAQLSLAYSGGGGSPVVFNTFWSPLTCSGIAFAPVTLSNGVTISPSSLLDTLVTQTTLAIKENRSSDMGPLASIWALLNGRCG